MTLQKRINELTKARRDAERRLTILAVISSVSVCGLLSLLLIVAAR